MRLVQTESAPDGARLAWDVSGGRGGAPLLRAGVRLDGRYRDAISAAGVTRIVVDDEETEGIDVRPPLADAVRKEAVSRLGTLIEQGRQALRRGERLPYRVIGAAVGVASLLADEVLAAPGGPVTLVGCGGAQGHEAQHPVDVTVLGLLVARRLFGERGRVAAGGRRSSAGLDDALRRLAVGLVLHDIALEEACDPVQVEQGAIADPPVDELRVHVERGHGALPLRIVSAHAAAVVRYHHERWQGSGPAGLVRERIPQFARIAAVADTYAALTGDRPGIPAVPAHVAIAAIARGAGTLFDPEVVEMFRWTVAPYPVGSEVTLSNGFSGVVAAVPSQTPHRPSVRLLRDPQGARITPREVALHRLRGLAVADAA